MQVEYIPKMQLLKVGKHLLIRHTAVTGKHCMGTLAANRERTANNMSNRLFQSLRIRAVRNRQICVGSGDLNVTHDTVTIKV